MSNLVEIVMWTLAVAGIGWSHVQAVRGPKRMPSSGTVAMGMLDLVLLLLLAVALGDRSLWKDWMQEDGWVEWSTAVAFGLAAFLLVRRARASWAETPAGAPDRPLTSLGWLGLAAFCLVVVGEEISWGQRLFAFKPPEIFLEANFQQELNVHNLLKGKELGGFRLDSRFLVAAVAIAYGVLYRPLCTRFVARVRFRSLLTTAPPTWLMPYFALVAAFELAYPISLGGEAAELFLGLLFLAVASEPPPGKFPPVWKRPALLATGTLGGLVLAPVIQLIVVGSDEEAMASAQAEVRALASDLQLERRIFEGRAKKSAHKRLFTAVRAGYLRFDAGSDFLENQPTPALAPEDTTARRDRKGYFLDPWNNPYWVYYSRKHGFAVVYSFGPNRRRDTNIKKLKKPDRKLLGDDIGVRLDWAR